MVTLINNIVLNKHTSSRHTDSTAPLPAVTPILFRVQLFFSLDILFMVEMKNRTLCKKKKKKNDQRAGVSLCFSFFYCKKKKSRGSG